MKRLWIAAGLLCAVIGLCIVTEVYQHRRMEDMLATLNRMEQAYEQGDLDQARVLAEDMAAQYEHISRVMMCFIAHSDVAESLETVTLLPVLLEEGGGEELVMEIARLREEFDHLHNIDDPLIWNIL